MRKLTIFLSLTMAHAVLSIGAIVLAFSSTMAGFDAGSAPSIGDRALLFASKVLLFPMGTLSMLAPRGWFSGLRGYAVFLLNSAFWAGVSMYAYLAYREMVSRRN